jgi:heme oxygenase (biliverdin-IX-beta and delta-forming)
MSKGSLHERLRAATRPLHDDLERSVDIEARLRTLAHYADHLALLWRLHVVAEQALHRVDFSRFGFVYPYPYRSSLLERDLAGLGVNADDLARLGLPRSPVLQTTAEGLGCMYVVEGSAKGARSILPEIKRSLDLDRTRGAAFFFGFGKETGRLWHAFMAAIDAIEADSEEGDAVVRSAVQTFEMFRLGLIDDAPQVLRSSLRVGPSPGWHLNVGPETHAVAALGGSDDTRR